jgi:C-methyltransferase
MKESQNSCRICSSVNFTEFLHINHFPFVICPVSKHEIEGVEFFPLTISLCDNCYLIQQINLLSEEILDRVYANENYGCLSSSPYLTGMGIREIEKFYSFFTECKVQKGKLLEIASFDGYLLKKILDDDWDAYGCDPSPLSDLAIKNLGDDRITRSFFKKDLFPSESFDVIIFRNLLEHLYDLHEFLEAISACLKPGGRIFIDVPNIESILDIGGLGTFFHQHVSYFSLQTLSTLLDLHDFTVDQSYEGSPNLFVSARKGSSSEDKQVQPPIKLKTSAEKKEFLNQTKKIENQIKDIFYNSSHQKIALFGASALATTIINLLPENLLSKIKYVFDNDPNKDGKFIMGCKTPISSPAKVIELDFDCIVVATYFFDKEIVEQLVDTGIDKDKILTFSYNSDYK